MSHAPENAVRGFPGGGSPESGLRVIRGIYSLTDHARLGLEISHWTTEFVRSGRAADLRTRFSLLYDF